MIEVAELTRQCGDHVAADHSTTGQVVEAEVARELVKNQFKRRR